MIKKDKYITRRQFLKWTSLATAAFAGSGIISACSPADREAPGGKAEKWPRLNIGYIPITDATPLLIAHARGFYAQEGIEAPRPVLIRGWSSLGEAFMAGRFNLTHLLSPIPVYMRYGQNFPVKVVAWNHMNNSAITVRDGGGIESESDLGGKKIAVPHWYSVHNVILQYILRHYNINVKIGFERIKDNETGIAVMAPPDMPSALRAGQIDGYIVAEPFNAVGELLAGGKILRFSGDVWKNHACCVSVMREKDINTHPRWAQKVVNAVVKAQLWSLNNTEEAARILSKDGGGYLPFEYSVVLHAMTKYGSEHYGSAIKHGQWNSKRISFQPYQYRSYTEKLVELLKETKLEGSTNFLRKLSPSTVAEELMDYEMVKKSASLVTGLAKFDGVDPGEPYRRREIIKV